MKRIALVGLVLTGVLLAPRAGVAQVACTREGLQRAVDLYIAAQSTGDTSSLPLPMGVGFGVGQLITAAVLHRHREETGVDV